MPDTFGKNAMSGLQTCENEPIHQSGGIQPVGVLLILDAVHYRIIQVSANCAALIGKTPQELLGERFDAVVAPALAAAVLAWHGQSRALFLPPIRFAIARGAATMPVDMVAHRIDDTVQVEILPVPAAGETPPNLFHDLLKLSESISHAANVPQLLALAATEVAGVTGAQRVMAYEFDAAFHGTVTFEILAPGCEDSYMGLKFPASDIPAQARAMYLKNRIRVIADTHYRPVPLAPLLHPVTGQPADLTHALLRSVSPVHLEYLGNMGVRGSMSISLVVNGALWGMLICHHDLPLLLAPDQRNYCEVLGQIVSLHVGQILQIETSQQDLRAQQTLFNIFPNGQVRERFAQILMKQEASLLSLFAADGMVLQHDGRNLQSGMKLDDDALRSLATLATLATHATLATADARDAIAMPAQVVETASLANALARAGLAPVADCGGFLYVPMTNDGKSFILFVRREQISQVNWAGNPHKASDSPETALAPRKSFAQWQETVRGQCTPWTPTEQRCARQLAILARDRIQVEAIKATQDQLMQAEKLASIGQLAAGVAHEINNPIGFVSSNLSTLQRYWDDMSALVAGYDEVIRSAPDSATALARAARLKKGIDFDFLKEDTPELILQSRNGITRVRDIVQNLKDFSHVGSEDQWVFADLASAMDSTLKIVLPQLRDKVTVQRHYESVPQVWCVPSEINQVFVNLLVNAGQAIETTGTITIGMQAHGESVAIDISDTGVGIAPDIQARIFDPFFTTRDVGKGAGLGLSIAYGIVERHRGHLSVQSVPGQGTTLRIVLPIRAPT